MYPRPIARLPATLQRLAAALSLGLVVACSAVAGNTRATQPVSFAGYTSTVPEAWRAETPASSMRAAQYRVPGSSPEDSAEFVVFYFGPHQGGSVDDNIARWASQFSSAEGGPVEPVIQHRKVRDYPVTTAELRGRYARNVGMGQQGEPKPDQVLLAGIVETPTGNLFIQLHGAARTVEAGRDGFNAFIEGIRTAAQ